MRKFIGTLLTVVMIFSIAMTASGCGDKKEADIYYLNFKPEIADQYDQVVKAYEEETGNVVKVVTAASGEYETTLKSEIAKSEYPTIFQINGPIGYESWKDYCADLKGTKLYEWLTDKNLAVKSGDGIYGIPYTVEGYGIIYNDAIMEKYFETDDAEVKSMDEIDNYETLAAVVEDMTDKKDQLGIEGVFASTSMRQGDQWRWQTHLANVPFYYEWEEKDGYDSPLQAGVAAKTVDFKYNANYKNVFDLYTQNSTTEKGLLADKTTDDSMAEFALGQCAMVQNGSWAWSQIKEVDGNVVEEDDIKFLPIYTGMEGEEKQGLCIGTENYLAINSKATEEEQAAAIAFMEWLFSSDQGKEFVLKDLGFIAPFDTFDDDEKPSDPLNTQVVEWMNKDKIESVPWVFQAFPSEEFKNQFGAALLEYATGDGDWDRVVNLVQEEWETEHE